MIARLPFKFNSIKFEISFLFSLVTAVILLIFSGVLYFIIATTLYRGLDYDLKLKAEEVGNSIRSYMDIQKETPKDFTVAVKKTLAHQRRPSGWLWAMGSNRRWLQQLDRIDLTEVYINFVDASGHEIASSKGMNPELKKSFARALKMPKNNQPAFSNISYEKIRVRVINAPFVYKNNIKYYVQVGMHVQPITQLLQGWLRSILLSMPFILALASFIGWTVASRILVPVERLTATAKRITTEDLNARIQQEEFAVEMNSLIEAFNGMVSRLEQSFRHIDEFSSHVAHELKTPLTIIKGEAELALMEERDPRVYKKTLNIILEELDKMLTTIEDLLTLARLNYQPDAFRFKVFDFTSFFKEICEQAQIMADAKKIQVGCQLPEREISINADALHLRRLFFNLIDNALKFTPAGGRLELAAKKEDGKLVVSVSDTGQGISRENIEKVFDKFFREDTRSFGVGLGLNIVQSIARLHQGSIRVRSMPGMGATFIVTLPIV